MDEILTREWAAARLDRGHGHFSYAVVLKDDASEIVIKTDTNRELAEHLVRIHNAFLHVAQVSGGSGI